MDILYIEKIREGINIIDSSTDYARLGNINYVIIKNSDSAQSYDEYIRQAQQFVDELDEYTNLNMNIIFIHNIISDESLPEDKIGIEDNSTSEKIKLKNNNVNIMVLKNVIKIKGVKQ